MESNKQLEGSVKSLIEAELKARNIVTEALDKKQGRAKDASNAAENEINVLRQEHNKKIREREEEVSKDWFCILNMCRKWQRQRHS